MRPYTPLELAGRNIYVREGCYNCHSQMIRPLRDEVERYGHYSLAAELMYDHPFQWGSKRTGPDLARVGGKYSDAWHARSPQRPAVGRPRLDHAGLSVARRDRRLDLDHIGEDLSVQAALGVPYTPGDDRQRRRRRAHAGLGRRADDADALLARYPKANVRAFAGTGRRPAVTEADALIAYLQSLGTAVDFKLYDDKANIR